MFQASAFALRQLCRRLNGTYAATCQISPTSAVASIVDQIFVSATSVDKPKLQHRTCRHLLIGQKGSAKS
jgi:hypothetical protein